MRVWIITACLLLVLDGLWIGGVAKHFYLKEIGPLLNLSEGHFQLRWMPTVCVYVALVVGIVLFVLPKAPGQPILCLCWGGLWGLLVYGVYNMTNLATLALWTVKMSVVDSLWGTVVCGLTSACVALFYRP